jgi:GNAT superfamily N-acetyltransferase
MAQETLVNDQSLRTDLDLAPNDADVSVVHAGLLAYNRSQLAGPYAIEFAVYLREAGDRIVGGVVAEAGHGWLHIRILWVAEELRGKGHGRRLLEAAEGEGRRRGCHSAHVDTFSFQARPFYERCGYVVFGTLEGYRAGHERYFLRKALAER